MFDYIHPVTERRLDAVRRDDVRHHRHAVRFQLLASFGSVHDEDRGHAMMKARLDCNASYAELRLRLIDSCRVASSARRVRTPKLLRAAARRAPARKCAGWCAKKRKSKSSAGAASAKTSACPARAADAASTANVCARPAAKTLRSESLQRTEAIRLVRLDPALSRRSTRRPSS